ncbi:CBR1 [Symbiodinium sp. CCMP2592]|nr:CBR1 [Symbiodinium sp. CCMP2592]
MDDGRSNASSGSTTTQLWPEACVEVDGWGDGGPFLRYLDAEVRQGTWASGKIFCKEPVTLQASSQLSQNGMQVDLERLRHHSHTSEVCSRRSSISESYPQPFTPVFGVGARPTSCDDTRQVRSDVPWGEALSASSGTSEHQESFNISGSGSRDSTHGRRKRSLGLRNREGSRCSSSDFPAQTVTASSVSCSSRRGKKPLRKQPAQPIWSAKDGQPETLLDASMLAEVFGRDRSDEIEKVLEQWQEYQLLRSELPAQDLKREVRSLRSELARADAKATRAEAEAAEARQVEAETAQAELAVLRAVRAEVLSERQAEREEYQEESKELRYLNSEESKQLRHASSELAELQTALEASELQPFQLEQERDQWADRYSAVSDELHMQRIMCRRLEHDGSNLRGEYLEESAAHRALELRGGELARLHQNEVQEVQQLRQELQQLKKGEEAQCQEFRQAQHDLIEVRCEHRSVESQLEHQTQRLLERPDQAPASRLGDAQQLESKAEPEPQRQRWLAQAQLEQPDQRPLESSSPDQLGPHVDLQRLLIQTHVLQGPEALPLASSLHDPASPGEFLRELRAVIGASSRLAGGAGAAGVDYAVKAASEALRRAEARCEISRLRSQAMEADLAALVETGTAGSAGTQPNQAAGSDPELEEDSPRRKLWEQEEEDDASDASEGTLGADLVQAVQIRQLSHLALAGLQLLMRAAFVGWRDQRQLSDIRCKENLLKAWSSHGGRHLSSRLALLCCRTLFGIWRQLVVVSRGRLHHLSLGQAPGFVRRSLRRTSGALQLLERSRERVWLLGFVLSLWSSLR